MLVQMIKRLSKPYLNPSWPGFFFFHRFSWHNSREALFVYRLIVTRHIEIFLGGSLPKLKFWPNVLYLGRWALMGWSWNRARGVRIWDLRTVVDEVFKLAGVSADNPGLDIIPTRGVSDVGFPIFADADTDADFAF